MPDMFWMIPLVLIFIISIGRRRRHGGRWDRGQDSYIAELEQRTLEQQARIDDLEARLARVEDGLDFAERVLADPNRTRTTTPP